MSKIALANCEVLVVDDEPLLREVLQMMLEDFGCTVRIASDGSQATHIFAACPDFALVFVDFSMPVLNGFDLYQELRQINPRTRFVMMSGLHKVPQVVKLGLQSDLVFLHKPFTEQQLLSAITRVATS